MDQGGDVPLSAVVSRVVDDAKEVAQSEFALVKARAASKLTGYRGAAICFVAAAALAHLALIGLAIGLIATLTPRTGPGWATLIVVGTLFVAAGILAWVGLQRWKRA